MALELLDKVDDFEFIDPLNHTNETEIILFCKRILLQQIGNNSIRLWDVAILIPNVIFMVFLLYKAKRIKAKLAVTKSPVFKAFYILVYIITIVGILRCVVSMSVSATNVAGDIADKILWLVLKFFMLSAELCVLTFGLLFGHLDSRTSIRRVLVATVLISLIFSTVQSSLEFRFPDRHYTTPAHIIIDLFAHGGMLFCMVTSAVFVLIYVTACILPLTKLKDRFALPSTCIAAGKRRFYVYCGFLATAYGLQVIGAALIFRDIMVGMCILDLTTYIYFALYTPVVYFTFLRGYESITHPGLLFSYGRQKDEGGDGELPNSGNYYPGFPGITSPSFDDILYQPDIYDSTDLTSPISNPFVFSPNPLYEDVVPSASGDFRAATLVIRGGSGEEWPAEPESKRNLVA